MSLEELIPFKVDQANSELIKTASCEGFCHWSLKIPSSSTLHFQQKFTATAGFDFHDIFQVTVEIP